MFKNLLDAKRGVNITSRFGGGDVFMYNDVRIVLTGRNDDLGLIQSLS